MGRLQTNCYYICCAQKYFKYWRKTTPEWFQGFSLDSETMGVFLISFFNVTRCSTMNIYDFYNQTHTKIHLILSRSFNCSFLGSHPPPALFSQPTPFPKSFSWATLSACKDQNFARCSLQTLKQLLKAHSSRRPFLVMKRKEVWLIPTLPNTVLPHLCLPCPRKSPASLLVVDLSWPCVCVCVCTWLGQTPGRKLSCRGHRSQPCWWGSW